MKNRLETAGVVLEGVEKIDDPFAYTVTRTTLWTVDGEPMPSVDHAVELWAARIYGSSIELPHAITQHIRKYSGLQLACPMVMVRRARERGGNRPNRRCPDGITGVGRERVRATPVYSGSTIEVERVRG